MLDTIDGIDMRSILLEADDIVGNRTSRDVSGNNRTLYAWDALNRMTFTNGYTAQYRADGMRVMKDPAFLVWNNGNWSIGRLLGAQSTWFCYDGQMPVEEFTGLYVTEPKKYSRNAIGARGIDMVESWEEGSQAVRAYPLYDAHGNNVATLTKGSGSTYTVGNRRTYDAWGAVRSGSTAGKQKYCATLGHVEDEESGLVYMRARYYEPSSGRFLSEDPLFQGNNWYIYGLNRPVSQVDVSGCLSEDDARAKNNAAFVGILISLSRLMYSAFSPNVEVRVIAWSGLAFLAAWFQLEYWTDFGGESLSARIKVGSVFLYASVGFVGGPIGYAVAAGRASPAMKAVDAVWAYASILSLFLALENYETQ